MKLNQVVWEEWSKERQPLEMSSRNQENVAAEDEVWEKDSKAQGEHHHSALVHYDYCLTADFRTH